MFPLTDSNVIASERTLLGDIILCTWPLPDEPATAATGLMLDAELLMTSCNTASEEALATLAVQMHGGDDLSVLIGGLGLGYTARAALAAPRVREVEVVELIPAVIDWMKQGLLPLSAELVADERLNMRSGDAYRELVTTPSRPYDIILVDVDHSPEDALGPSNEAFHSREGMRSAARHLAPAGVLGVWSFRHSADFERAVRDVYREVRVAPITFANALTGEEETNYLYLARGPIAA